MNRFAERIHEFRQNDFRRRLIAFLSAFVLLFSTAGSAALAAVEYGYYSDAVTVPPFQPEETPATEGGETDETGTPAEIPEGAETAPEATETEQNDTEEAEETVAESIPEIVYEAGSLTAETEGCSIRLDYTAEACIPEGAVLAVEPAKGADLYAALKSAAKLVRNEETENETWKRQVAEEGNLFYLVTLTDAEGNPVQPQAGMTLTSRGIEIPEGRLCLLTGENARNLEAEEGTLTISDYRLEAFGYAAIELVQAGTVTLECSGPDYQVTASYGPEAGFPADTEMKVREIRPGTPEYALYSGMTEEALAEDWSEITLERFFDITFVSGDKELEPLADVDVQILFKDVIELTDEHDVHAVHIENNEAKVIESETDSNESAAKGNSEAIDTVSFTSDSFSVFGVVQRKKISQKVLAADGNTYEINVTYGQEAGIPENAELLVEEIPQGSDLWEAYRKQTAAALGADDVRLPGLYDISILVDGQKIEPLTPVNVSIRLANAESGEELHVVHFTEALPEELVAPAEKQTEVQPLAAEERISSEKITDAVVEGDTVTFDTDGFSVYAFAYTVVVYYRTASGDNYRITLDYGPDSGIPAGAELHVEELLPGDERYAEHLAKALRRVAGTEDGEEAEELVIPEDQYARFFDIEIRADGQKIEPEGSVSVTFELADAPEDRQEELKVLHFTGEKIDIIDAEVSADAGILFETDAFSVYGVVTFASANPGVNDLDGRSVTISHSGNYITSGIVTGGTANRFNAGNSSSAIEWTFEDAGETGKYYIYTLDDHGIKQYMNLVPIDPGNSRANAVLSASPQPFTVSKNGNVYNFKTDQIDGKEYYLNDFRNETGFAGWHATSNDNNLTLNFTDLVITNNVQYMTLVKYGGKYYIVNNDGTLTEVEYDPVTKMVSTDDPLLWNYTTDNGPLLYINTEGKTFTGPGGTANSFYRRFIDAQADSGIYTEDASHQSGENESRFVFEGNHIRSQQNSSQYLGVTLDENGVPVRISGNKSASEAVDVLFASVIDVTVPSHYARNQAVTHLDVSIHGNAQLDYPLPRGTYYDANGNVLYTITRDNPKTISMQEPVPIDKDDIKKADIIATDVNGNEIDNAFYVSGYTGNQGDSNPDMPTQIRIEGSFIVANNVTTAYPNWNQSEDRGWHDGWGLRNNSTHQQIRRERLASEVTYTVTTTKMVEFTLMDGDQVLYDQNGQPIKVEVPVTMTGSCSYWSAKNTCPGIENNGGRWPNDAWAQGCIVGDSGAASSGIDFTLGGSTKQQENAYPAVDITKYVVDENGTLLSNTEAFRNTFKVYLIENSSQSSEYNTNYSAYTEESALDIQVLGGVGKNYYDLNTTSAMVYVEEDKASIPETIMVNGMESHYVKTVIETEYVRRESENQPNRRTDDLTLEGNEHYNSIPELAGAYRYNGEARNNAILNFYVYNVYTSVTEVTLAKEWANDSEVRDERPDAITLTLNRYQKDGGSQPPSPDMGTLNIAHISSGIAGTSALPAGFTATYSYDGPASASGISTGNYRVPAGRYTVTATVTNDAAPSGYSYVSTNTVTVDVPADGVANAVLTSTYSQSTGTLVISHTSSGLSGSALPAGFAVTYSYTGPNGTVSGLSAGSYTVPAGNYTVTANVTNSAAPSGYIYNNTTGPVTVNVPVNGTGNARFVSNYSVRSRATVLVYQDNYGYHAYYFNNNSFYEGDTLAITWTRQGHNPGRYKINGGNWTSFQFRGYNDVTETVTVTVPTSGDYRGIVLIQIDDSWSDVRNVNVRRSSGRTAPLRYRADAGASSGGTTGRNLNLPEGYGNEPVDSITVTLTSGEDWTKVIENLPIMDENGEPYYYAIEEEPVPGYTVTYSPSEAVNATELEEVTLTAINTLHREYVTEYKDATVNKTDKTNPLSGAVFTLFREETETEGTGETEGTDESDDSEESDGIEGYEPFRTYSMGEDATSFVIDTEDEEFADLLPEIGESVTLKLKETTAPEGYYPSENIWDVEITATQSTGWNEDHTAWTTTTLYNITVNGENSLTVPNTAIRDIRVTKYVTDRNAPSNLLDGKTITIGLYREQTEEETGNATGTLILIETAEMTINGDTVSELLFTGLDAGTYYVYELDESGQPLTRDGEAFVVHNETEDTDDIYSVRYSGSDVTLTDPGDEQTVTVTNNREGTGNLTVAKKLAGDGAEMTDVFHFTVRQTSSPKISGDYGEMHFEDGVATFTLGHDGTMSAEGLPYGFEYTVTETEANQNGYLTVYDTVSDLTTETAGENGEIQVHDEADSVIRTDETETVTVTNTKLLMKSLKVTKEYMGIPYAETENYPAVSFALWQTDGNGWGHAQRYTGEAGDDFDYGNIVLNYENNWTWECPVELPEEDGQGNTYRYFAVEKPVRAQGNHGTGELILTDPLIEDFPIWIEGYQFREVKDVGRWSDTVHFQQPNRAAVPNHGEIKILNKTPGYMQMDLKKKFLDYRPDGTGNYSLYTTTGETETMRDMIIELQIMRVIIDDSSGQDVFISDGWEEYGEPFRIGYDAGGGVVIDNSNPFRVENSGGSWHFQVVENNRNHGLPKYGLYKKADGTVIVVRYRYLFKETRVFDGNMNLRDNWVAWLPYAWDANGRQYPVSTLQTAQDQDRMLNAPGTTLTVEKEWIGSHRNVAEVYIKVSRREWGTTGPYEDYLTVLGNEMDMGTLAQKHFGSNSQPVFDNTYDRIFLNEANGWKAVIDKVQMFPNGNNHNQYEYRIDEIGYKDTAGNTYGIVDVQNTFEPEYSRGTRGNPEWEPQDTGLLITLDGPNKLKVTNTAPYGALEIIKQVPEASETAAESTDFTFDVSMTLPEGITLAETDLTIEDGTIGNYTADGTEVTFKVTRTGAGNTVIGGIPYGTTYEVTENEVPSGWKKSGEEEYSDTGREVSRTDETTDTVTVTNEEITSLTVVKHWAENGEEAGWPEGIATVTVGLYPAADEENPMTLTFGADAEEEDRTFSDLPVYDDEGNPISYSVRELSVTTAEDPAQTFNVDETTRTVTVTGTFAGTWNVSVSEPDEDGLVTVSNEQITTDIHILKVETPEGETDPEESPKPLAGAKFRLYRKNAENTYEAVGENIAVGEDGEEKGKATISGLIDGEYRLKEIKAPSGYIPLSSPIDFTVAEGVVTFTGTDAVTYSSDDATFTVGNKAGLALPTTGGSGTLAYTLSGLGLVLLAIVLMMFRKRKFYH